MLSFRASLCGQVKGGLMNIPIKPSKKKLFDDPRNDKQHFYNPNNFFSLSFCFSAFKLVGMLFMIRFVFEDEVKWPGAAVHNLSKYFPHKSFSCLLRVPFNRSFFSALYLSAVKINKCGAINNLLWPDILPLMKSLNFWWKNSDSKS
jgi:hypothetical protein